ncbi:MAG: ABC transporter permease [Acidimicrobiia bacterium]
MVTEYLGAAAAVVRRDVRTAFTYRTGLVTQLLGGFFSLTLFFYVSRLIRVSTFASPDAYYAFVVVGLLILQIVNSVLQSPPARLRQEMVAGTLERLVISPFGATGALAASLVFPVVNALVLGLAMLGSAALVFDLSVRWSTAALAVPVALLGALAFAPFGLLLMAVVLVMKQATAGATWIIAGLSLIAGLYFPVELLPDWIGWASAVQPFTPTVDLLRNVLVGTPLPEPAWQALAGIVAFIAILVPASLLAVRLSLRIGCRRGTLTEY